MRHLSSQSNFGDQFGGAPFDIEGDDVFWSYQDERRTFDVMVDALGLAPFDALKRLAVIGICITGTGNRSSASQDHIERFYNPKRRHSTIGYLSPMEFEANVGLA